ncbi:MAG: HDOD domain-containing protein [Pseudomonadales bacterium]
MQPNIDELLEYAERHVRFPHSALEIAQLAQSANCANQDIAEVIEQDPAFTAQLLRVVNSPAYRTRESVGSVADAIFRVGRKEIAELAFVISSDDAFSPIESDLMQATTFWSHSVITAQIAVVLADYVDLKSDNLFAAALLHDIGFFLLCRTHTASMTEVLELTLDQELELFSAERSVLGFSHAELGAALVRHWGLPEDIASAIQYHSAPEICENHRATAECVGLANELALADECNESVGDHIVSRFISYFGVSELPLDDLLQQAKDKTQRQHSA